MTKNLVPPKYPQFGMKAHVLQMDGLSFLDTMSFNNFNETTRLKLSVLKHKRIFWPDLTLGANRIYASNANRRYCTEKGIFTCFSKKGPKKHSKQEQILSSELAKHRTTVMEGVFGTHKDFYGLGKIRVRGEKREKLMALFAHHGRQRRKDCQKKNRRYLSDRKVA